MASDAADYRFSRPVLCLTPTDLSYQLRSFGEVIRPRMKNSLFNIPSDASLGKTVNVAVLSPVVHVLETLIEVSGLFRDTPSIMTNTDDLGPFEVILRGYRENEQVFFAHSVRFKTEILVAPNFEMTVFYLEPSIYASVIALLQILVSGRSVRAVYQLCNGACGARYWDPGRAFNKFSAARVEESPLSRLSELAELQPA